MIVVVADDLSGAAEVAGAAFARGLSAAVHTVFAPAASADVVVIDSDTRSASAVEGASRLAALAPVLRSCQPAWLFKKVDSVFRGHVGSEIQALAAVLGKRRSLLAPANPSRGRIIHQGRYCIHGIPLHETDFARDPEHPIHTNHVIDLLGIGADHASSLSRGQPLPQSGVIVVDAVSVADLRYWAEQADDDTLLAGGVEFFEAVLAIRCPDDREAPACTTTFPATASRLFVCGSAAAWHKARQRQCAAHGIPVLTMPAELATSQPSVAARKRWIESAVQAIAPTGAAMMAIGSQDAEVSPPVLARRLAEAVQGALESIRVDWLLVEGGATAAALVRQMRWTRFRVRSPHSPGVVALDIDGTRQPALILKPGSYEWPDYVWPR